MNEIEKIQKYIQETDVTYQLGTPYQLKMGELCALHSMGDGLEAICLAFEYGLAKGERSARAAQRQRKRTTA